MNLRSAPVEVRRRAYAELERLEALGLPATRIASELGKSPSSVYSMRCRRAQRLRAGKPAHGEHAVGPLPAGAYGRLVAWQADNSYTLAQLGSAIGCLPQTIAAWRRGHVPTLLLAVKIEALTGIAPRDWFPDDYARLHEVQL